MNATTETRRFNAIDWSLVIAIGLLLSTLLIPRRQAAPPEASEPASASPEPTAAEQWGIQPVGIRVALGGNMLDFRYSILDPAKAAAIRKQTETACLIDEATSTRLPLAQAARAGSSRLSDRDLEAGRTYSLQFPNPGRHFKPGSRLTLVMGDFRAENLVVQ